MPSQLTVWPFTSLLNVINHPHTLWRRPGGYWHRSIMRPLVASVKFPQETYFDVL
jgi:hypothetical protein